jgi:tetratricopeptide (TPR) repeat protein
LLALAAFLIPFVGGSLPNDVLGLESGYVATVQALFRGSEVATLQHALLGLLVVGAFAYLIIKRKIVQVPHVWISAPLAALIALLMGSVFISNYRWVSETALAEWVVYALALVAAVAGLGRRNGPLAVIVALAMSSGIVGLLGIKEYFETRAIDPTWRIFGGWNNPNALAGMMLIGFILNLGLLGHQASLTASSSLEARAPRSPSPSPERHEGNPRLVMVLAAIGVIGTGVALVLTGSKGGLYSLVPSLAVFLTLVALWTRKASGKALLAAAVCILVVIGASAGIKLSSHGGGVRSLDTGSTQEQSAGFRVQLWKGAVSLVKESPVGHGLATYAYLSAKPGTNTRTELAHSTWLQLAVEAGVLAPVALAALLLSWLALCFRGASGLPVEQNVLRAAVVAAVLGTAAHGLVESNLYFFGIGLSFFLLIGVGIQLSADAGAPEFVAIPMRVGAVLVSLLCLGQLLFAGFVAKLQANVRSMVQANQLDDARSTLETLRGIAPFDGETWYRSAPLASSPDEELDFYKQATLVAPSAKYFRRLAAVQQKANKLSDAETSLVAAQRLDPNNLTTLLQMMLLLDKLGSIEDAKLTARQLIDVESTPYFKVRSIPEIVPTETYQARVYLAKTEGNKIPLLRAAVEGFEQYANTTVPYVKQMKEKGADGVLGVSVAEAHEKMLMGLDAAKQLDAAYRAAGDKAGAQWAETAGSTFALAADGTK